MYYTRAYPASERCERANCGTKQRREVSHIRAAFGVAVMGVVQEVHLELKVPGIDRVGAFRLVRPSNPLCLCCLHFDKSN